ncbi:MAG: hypothetical protein Kow0047_06770 [Anaerolineae bacterium]
MTRREPLRLEAFDALRAEEEPWLLECFVPPPRFDEMLAARSTIITGDIGSGKTAVLRALKAASRAQYLVADWEFRAPGPPFDRQVLQAIGWALLEWAAADRDRYGNISAWARRGVHWLIRKALIQGEIVMQTYLRAERMGADALAIIERIAGEEPVQLAMGDVPISQTLAMAVNILEGIGLSGAWIFCDRIEPQWLAAESDAERLLVDLLSTLPTLDVEKIVYKLAVPADLWHAIGATEGIRRLRAWIVPIEWPLQEQTQQTESEESPSGGKEEDAAKPPKEDPLRELAERRLGLALGTERVPLSRLCKAPEFQDWLYRVGGAVPREWLSALHPVVSAFLRQAEVEEDGLPPPLSAAAWEQIARRYRPFVMVLEREQAIQVGGRIVRDLSPNEWTILQILHGHRGQIVSRETLYEALFPNDAGSQDRGALDTALWRLRNAVEPLPKYPQIIVSARGKGIRFLPER